MKALKASKKLITSIICFALSLVLCVGVCLAWFAVNKKVESDGAKVGVRNSDIVKFKVTVHYLNGATGGYRQASTGNVTGAGNVDINGDGVLVSEDSMRPYGGLATFTTAVLFEIDYEIVTSDKHYRIYASCPEDNAFTVEPLDEEKKNFESALSNTVGFYDVKVSNDGEVFSKSGNQAEAFIKNNNDKRNVIMLKENIVPSTADEETGNYVGKTYVIMDYMPESFIYLSSLMIGAGGSLQSKLSLPGDLTVNIEVYDPDNPDTPVGPEEPEKKPVQGSKTFGTSSGAVEAGGNVFELLSEGVTVASVNSTSDRTWSTSSKYIQPSGKGNILTFQLAEGYTYTIKMELSTGGADKTLTFSFNGVDGSAQQVSGNVATECVWTLSGGTYTFNSTTASTPRLYSISITATPVNS